MGGIWVGTKGKGGKEVKKEVDGFRAYPTSDGTKTEVDWVTSARSRIKKRNVSLQHYHDNWDKIFKGK